MFPLITFLSIFITFIPTIITASSYDYAITIDAGSSGTRFYIYQWEHRHASGTIPPFSLPITQSGWSEKMKPGISSLVSNPTLAATEAYFTSFLALARDLMMNISSTTRLQDVPITLKATAGMRIIPNITLRDSIMENIRTVFSNKAICPFYFDRATGARIISGEEEAIFGWLTVNHLMKTLIPPLGQPARTWGAMDLGGASTQITFDPSTELLANSFALDIPTHPYLLYAHSHLYFGIDQLVNRSIIRVLNDRVGDVAFHPCYPLGYNTTIATLTGNVTMYGLSNTTACRTNIYELLSKSSPCFSSPSPDACSFAGVYQPSIPQNMNFVAFSSFGYIAKDSGLGEHGTMEQLSHLIPTICSLNYTGLEQHFPKKPEFMERLCLHLTYVMTLLHDGYGFPLTNDTHIWFTQKINSTNVEWPLGATLYEINSMSYDLDMNCSNNNNDVWTRWIPLIVACVLLALISIVMIRHCYRRHIHATQDDWKTTRDTRQHERITATDEIDVEQPLAYSRVNDRRAT